MRRQERQGLIERLRERGVLRVAASYVVIAWLALQIAPTPSSSPGTCRSGCTVRR